MGHTKGYLKMKSFPHHVCTQFWWKENIGELLVIICQHVKVYCPKRASYNIFNNVVGFLNLYLQRVDFKLFCGSLFFLCWNQKYVLAPTNELKILVFSIRKQLLYRRKLGLAVKHLIIAIMNIVLLGGSTHTWIHGSTFSSYLALLQSLSRQKLILMGSWLHQVSYDATCPISHQRSLLLIILSILL